MVVVPIAVVVAVVVVPSTVPVWQLRGEQPLQSRLVVAGSVALAPATHRPRQGGLVAVPQSRGAVHRSAQQAAPAAETARRQHRRASVAQCP